MHPKIAFRWLFLMLLVMMLIMPVPATAQAVSPYQAGMTAFKDGRYEEALKFFKQAEAQGNQSPNLFYNLGVTYYHIGRYTKAREAFERLLHIPAWKPFALYNLGLVAETSGKPERAAGYYRRARDAADPSSRIRRLAVQKSETMQPAPPAAEAEKWYGRISAAAGYDDNAVLAPDEAIEQVGEESDFFTDLFGFAGTYLSGRYADGIRIEAGGYSRFYAHETEFNATTLFAGISREKQYAQWHLKGAVEADAGFVENDFYAATPSLRTAFYRDFDVISLSVDNTLSWIEAQSPYAYLTGVRNRITIDFTCWISAGRVAMGYRFEYNDRENLQVGDEFFSYSPLRSEIYAELDYQPAPGWRMELRGAYRSSRYPDPNRQLNADGSLSSGKREDDRIFVSLRGGYMLTKSLTAFAAYARTDNDSNFPRYDYVSNQFMLGAEKSF